MESNDLEKSTNNIVASIYFARIPSMIRRIWRICDFVGRFVRKQFWFFLIRSDWKAEHYKPYNYASVVNGDYEVTFHREEKEAALRLLWLLDIDWIQFSENRKMWPNLTTLGCFVLRVFILYNEFILHLFVYRCGDMQRD